MKEIDDYVVYSCESCGKRIFTDKKLVGRKGQCPLCGAPTVVGGRSPDSPSGAGETPAPSASDATAAERRRAKRFKAPNAMVAAGKSGAITPHDLCAVEDLSETGVCFHMGALKDKKKLSGYGPPPLKLGDQLSVTLTVPEVFRPITVKAIVRRVAPHPTRKELFRVAVEFHELGEAARSDLRKLGEKR